MRRRYSALSCLKGFLLIVRHLEIQEDQEEEEEQDFSLAIYL